MRPVGRKVVSFAYALGWKEQKRPSPFLRALPFCGFNRSVCQASDIRDFAFFVFERTKHQPRRNLRSYLVLQRLCNEAALSPGIDAFWVLDLGLKW